jgi:ATP-dependent Lon protease
LEIVPVRWIDKVLEIALERPTVPLTDEQAAVATAAVAVEAAATADKSSNVVKH